MVELGGVVTGLRMIGAGVQWIFGRWKAKWSAVPMSATLSPHIGSWYQVKFFCINERALAIELITLRCVKPRNRTMRKNSNHLAPGMVAESEGFTLDGLAWTIPERNVRLIPFERFAFVNLAGLTGERSIVFEFTARFLDNRRDVFPVWCKTNVVRMPE